MHDINMTLINSCHMSSLVVCRHAIYWRR